MSTPADLLLETFDQKKSVPGAPAAKHGTENAPSTKSN